MAENSSGKKYTVDEILAEYDSMHNDSAEKNTPAKDTETDSFEQEALTEPAIEQPSEEPEAMEEITLGADENADSTTENNTESADGDGGIEIYDADAPDEQQMINDIIGHIKPVESFSAEANSKTPEEIFAESGESNIVSEPDDDEIIEEEQPEVLWDSGTEDAAGAEDEGIYIEELEEEPVSEDEVSAEALPDEETEEIFPDEDDEGAADEGAADEVTADEAAADTAAEDNSAEKSDDTDNSPERSDNAVKDTDTDGNATEEQTKSEESKEENAAESDGNEADAKNAEAEPLSENTEEKDRLAFIKGIIPWKGDSVFEIIRKIIFIAAVCVFVGAGIMLASTLVQSKKAINDSDEIKSMVTTTVATTIDSEGNVVTIAPTEEEIEEHNFDVMTYYKDINEDVVGFIELEGCDIYQPVVQGDDNEYYLTHTYYDGSNKAGSIFLDYRCRIEEDYTSPNLVVYGHNQEDGTMFGNLKDYKQDVDFYAANPTITFNTEYGVGTYLIYGFFVTNAYANQDSNGEVFRYHDYIETMNDEYTFNWYLEQVQERNQIISPVDVQFGDQLLCLSTCSNEFSNSRFVVFARKLRDGESVSDYDFTDARLNPYARGVDWEAIMSGETTVSETEETTEETSEETTIETDEETEETQKTKKTTAEETEETTAPEETEETKKTKKTKKTTAKTTVTEPSDTSNNSIVTDESGKPVTTVDTDESGQTVTAVVMTDESGSTVTSVVQTDENGEVVFTTVITDENGETVTAVPENNENAVTETGGSR